MRIGVRGWEKEGGEEEGGEEERMRWEEEGGEARGERRDGGAQRDEEENIMRAATGEGATTVAGFGTMSNVWSFWSSKSIIFITFGASGAPKVLLL